MDSLIAYGGIIIATAVFAIQYTFDDLQKGVAFFDASNNYEQNDNIYWQLRLLGSYYVQRARRREIPDFAPRGFFALQLLTTSYWAGLYGCFTYQKAQSGDLALELINGVAAGVFILIVILVWWRHGKAYSFYTVIKAVKKEDLFDREFGLSVELMMLAVLAGALPGVLMAWYVTQWSVLPGIILLLASALWKMRIEDQLGKQRGIAETE